jgi:hypothetical protein
MHTLTLHFPNLPLKQLEEQDLTPLAREAFILTLFRLGEIDVHFGATTLNISFSDFLKKAGEYGIIDRSADGQAQLLKEIWNARTDPDPHRSSLDLLREDRER